MRVPLVPPTIPFLRRAGSDLDPVMLERMLRLALSGIGPTPTGRYLHWDQLRHRPAPPGMTAEDFWNATKVARISLYRPIGLVDTTGSPFRFANVPLLAEHLHHVDRDASGTLRTPAQVTDPATRDRYLISSLHEEAITSSQLEGASTTRDAAKQMLREGRAPANHSERMIVNNYAAMEWLRSLADEPLSPAIVFELHRILTADTFDDPRDAGRFRQDSDEIVVSDETGRVLHRPPVADELAMRIEKMCAFASEGDADGGFLHPVVRSILLHFWLAYDHPFVDGNGRVARALFYWSMARHGYWLCEYVSISRILRRARAQYLRSFLYCETDDNDLTYFLVDQLRVLNRAIDDLHSYLARKSDQIRRAERDVRLAWKTRLVLNERQLALLAHALRTPNASYTLGSHRNSHGIAYETARQDLRSLVEDRLLSQHKRGRRFVFIPSANLLERVARLSRARS